MKNQFNLTGSPGFLALLGLVIPLAGGFAHAEPQHLVAQCGTYHLHGVLEAKPDALVLWKGTSRQIRLSIAGDCKRCGFFRGITVEAEARLVSPSPRRIRILNIKASAETEEFLTEKAAELVTESPCGSD